MCTILLAWRCVPDAAVVLAANRDELLGRASAPPGWLYEDPAIIGGRDLVAGGTWLAVAARGQVCAVTNRHPAPGAPVDRDPARRSRGEIPVNLLLGGADLSERFADLGPGVYNPVNVLWVSPERALVAHVDDTGPPRVTELFPGPHVLTVADVDDLDRPKVALLARGMDGALGASRDSGSLLARLRSLLAVHTSPSGAEIDAPCIHGEAYGTVSSSTVAIGDAGVAYEHAPGPPCVTPFAPVGLVP